MKGLRFLKPKEIYFSKKQFLHFIVNCVEEASTSLSYALSNLRLNSEIVYHKEKHAFNFCY